MLSISIIVPIYNVQDYIERCLDSILIQENCNIILECILINDCTTDASMDLVSKKLNGYGGNIKFIILDHTENRGLCAARNTGINAAHGEFVLFVDSDDRLEEGAIAYLVSGLEQIDSKDKVDIVVGNSFVCKNHKPAMDIVDTECVLINNKDEEGLCKLLNREIFHTVWNKLIKREIILSYHLYFEEGIIDEDLLWSYRAFLTAKHILVMPRITYIYEDNPRSIMNTTAGKVELRIKSRIVICNKLMDSPPREVVAEYYMYLFYVLTRAINLYEQYIPFDVSIREDLFKMRDRFLKLVKKSGCHLLFFFFLTSKKPLYYVTNFKLYRRYYDKIAIYVLKLDKCLEHIRS